jgi:hypothetical protein
MSATVQINFVSRPNRAWGEKAQFHLAWYSSEPATLKALVEGYNRFLNQFAQLPSAKAGLNLAPFEISCS